MAVWRGCTTQRKRSRCTLVFTAALLAICLAAGASGQDQKVTELVNDAFQAMLMRNVGSITYSGTASSAGQAPVSYSRTIDLKRLASRATAPYAELITTESPWAQQLEIWITPWGFLKGAAANSATLSSQRERRRLLTVLTWTAPQKSPAGMPYTVKGYINDANFVQRVETSLDDAKLEANFDEYIQMGKVVVPVKITVTRTGAPTFEVDVAAASPDPPNLDALLKAP